MRRYVLPVLLALSLLVNVGVIAGAWYRASGPSGAAERSLFGMGHESVPAYLGLDAAQRERWQVLEQDFVRTLDGSNRAIGAHRTRLVRELMSQAPDAAVIEQERHTIFTLQQAQQRSVIAQLLKEREILTPPQREALAGLLLRQGHAAAATQARP
jgi:Spy/CpxP family protein refolding chaperone